MEFDSLFLKALFAMKMVPNHQTINQSKQLNDITMLKPLLLLCDNVFHFTYTVLLKTTNPNLWMYGEKVTFRLKASGYVCNEKPSTCNISLQLAI